jgi:hypothetical protein
MISVLRALFLTLRTLAYSRAAVQLEVLVGAREKEYVR